MALNFQLTMSFYHVMNALTPLKGALGDLSLLERRLENCFNGETKKTSVSNFRLKYSITLCNFKFIATYGQSSL